MKINKIIIQANTLPKVKKIAKRTLATRTGFNLKEINVVINEAKDGHDYQAVLVSRRRNAIKGDEDLE